MADIYQDPLMQPIVWQGKEYRTSHYLHRYYLGNSPNGGKYQRHDNFIRILKGIEAYHLYVDAGDIVVLASYRSALDGSSEIEESNKYKPLRDAFAAVSYKTLYLVNPTIQAALSHHLDDEVSKKFSVTANTATARQLSAEQLPTSLPLDTIIKALAQKELTLEQGQVYLGQRMETTEQAVQDLHDKYAQLAGELDALRQAPQATGRTRPAPEGWETALGWAMRTGQRERMGGFIPDTIMAPFKS